MTVSIIIAVKTWQKNLEECVAKCRELDTLTAPNPALQGGIQAPLSINPEQGRRIDFKDYEILVLPDEAKGPQAADYGAFVRIIPTGVVSPGKKRDIAVKYAEGEILAYIDDDVFPDKSWLKEAVKNFTDPEVAAVGGPAITPPQDSFFKKASGRIYESIAVSGNFRYRYTAGKRQYVDDYPSCNFLVRKSVMEETGGFNTDFWPGEDTKLCLDITKKLGKKIVYDPNALVYHHRRPVFIAHLKQIASYALHRGYFVKRYPQTSFKAAYFIPTFFVACLFLGAAIVVFVPVMRGFYFTGLYVYFAAVLIFSITKDIRLIPFVASGTILTHLTYGINFLIGLLSKRLKEDI